MPTPEFHAEVLKTTVAPLASSGFFSFSVSFIVGLGAYSWTAAFIGAFAWGLFFQPPVQSTYQEIKRAFGIVFVSTFIGTIGAQVVANNWFSHWAVGVPIAFLSCYLVQILIDKEVQQALKARFITVISKGKLP
jgi:hypothetical protein